MVSWMCLEQLGFARPPGLPPPRIAGDGPVELDLRAIAAANSHFSTVTPYVCPASHQERRSVRANRDRLPQRSELPPVFYTRTGHRSGASRSGVVCGDVPGLLTNLTLCSKCQDRDGVRTVNAPLASLHLWSAPVGLRVSSGALAVHRLIYATSRSQRNVRPTGMQARAAPLILVDPQCRSTRNCNMTHRDGGWQNRTLQCIDSLARRV